MSPMSPFREDAEAVQTFESFPFADEHGPFVAEDEAEALAWEEELEDVVGEDDFEELSEDGFKAPQDERWGEAALEPEFWVVSDEEFETLETADLGAASPFAALLEQAFGRGSTLGAAEAAAAFATGVRDVNRLTDVVFHARHRERKGRSLARGEAQLMEEWRRIRASVVVPALSIAAPPATVVAPRSRYTLPPDPAHLRQPARAQVAAQPLMGDEVFAVETARIRDIASRPDGWVYMANWHAGLVDPNTGSLVNEPALKRFAAALTHCAESGGVIRALFWDGLYQLDPIIKNVTAPLAVVGGGVHAAVETLIRQRVASELNYKVNKETSEYINRLRKAAARLDHGTLLVGSHHQKILVVGNKERTVAVVGGVDLNKNRVTNGGAGKPYFDVSVEFDGPAAADVADEFERRWKAADDRRSIALPPRQRPTPARPSVGATVQVGVNYACGKPHANIRHAIRGGSELIKNLLRNCQTFFYAEDQYGIGNRELEAAIRQAFANGARYGIVVLANSQTIPELPDARYWRHQFWSKFPQTGKNLLVFERVGDDGDPLGPHAHVESKLVLVDDRAVSIGSLNLNQRSWYTDSEITAVITDTPAQIADLRVYLWVEHLTVGAHEIRDPANAFKAWQLAYTGARPRPRLRPLTFLPTSPPPRISDAMLSSRAGSVLTVFGRFVTGTQMTPLIARAAINSVMDRAHSEIFDPRGAASC